MISSLHNELKINTIVLHTSLLCNFGITVSFVNCFTRFFHPGFHVVYILGKLPPTRLWQHHDEEVS